MAETRTVTGKWFWVHVVSASIGVSMGILASLTFLILGNISAGMWAIVSSAAAAVVLHQHILFKNAKLSTLYDPLRFKVALGIGVVLSLISFSATTYYYSRKIQLNQPTYPIRDKFK